MTQFPNDIPKKIGHYEIEEVIGYSVQSVVYRGFDSVIGRTVAVKTLRLDMLQQSPEYKIILDRFVTEARVSSELSHPSIATFIDISDQNTKMPWLVMEFLEGQSVAQLLEGEQLQAEFVIQTIRQAASALDYAHSKNILHCGIKPSNLFILDDGQVKVTDFGIARVMESELNHKDMLLHTPGYFAPEQVTGGKLDGRSDIFSLGVVAFEMLSGGQPFLGNNVTSILYKLVNAEPLHPKNLESLGLIPDKWHQVFSKVLAKEREERYTNAAEFLRDLQLCVSSLEGETAIISNSSIASTAQHSKAEEIKQLSNDANAETVIMSNPTTAVSSTTLRNEGGCDQQSFNDTDAETVLLEQVEVAENISGENDTDAETVLLEQVEVAENISGEVVETIVHDRRAKDLLKTTDATCIPASRELEAKEVSAVTARRLTFLTFSDKKVLYVLGVGVILFLILVRLIVGWRSEPKFLPDPVPETITNLPMTVETGALSVFSEPTGARVFLNGVAAGITPLDFPQLEFGNYNVRLESKGFLAKKLKAELTVESPKMFLEVTLSKVPPVVPVATYLRVNSIPEGAQVQIDGRLVGSTPIQQVHVQAGYRTVRLTQEGYVPWEDVVHARVGATATVEAEMVLMEFIGASIQPEPEPEPEVDGADRVVEGDLVERDEPGVVDPKCIECPTVSYPNAARRTRLQGVVELAFLIDETGAVQDIQVVQSAGEVFDVAVVNVVERWKYEPATKFGVRVKIQWAQRFRFRRGL